jgi:hypothetical protein
MRSFGRATLAAFVFVLASMPVASLAADRHFHLLDQVNLVTAAHADEPAPAASLSPVEHAGDQVGHVGDVIGGIADKIPADGMGITIMIMVVGFLYDLFRRKFPSKNPASLWRDAKAVIAGVKKVLLGGVKLLEKLDQVGDKVLGQNLKQ